MSQAPGWYRDPFLRGHERYWDGHVWTQGTRPEGVQGSYQGDVTQAQLAHPDVVHPSAGTRSEPSGPSGPSEPPVPPASVAPPAVQSFAPLGGPSQPPVAAPAPAPAPAPGPAGGPATWAPPAMPAGGPQHARRGGHRRSAILGVAAAALVLVAGGVSAALVLGGSGNASAEEAVAQAASQTNAQSADMSLSIDVGILGQHESVNASGAFDFAHKLGTMTMTVPVNGKQYTEQEILDGSTVYVNVGDLSSGLAPTKPWVSESVSQLGTSGSGPGTLDPTSMLQQLQSSGGTVTSLGQTTYDGTSVTEYAATLPSSALMGDIGKLPSSLQQGVSGLHFPDMHMNIYVTADNLLKAVTLPSYSVSFSGQTMTMDMTMVLSNYGTPVNVTPPPADQVEPLSQLGGGLGNSGSTGNTGNSGTSGANV